MQFSFCWSIVVVILFTQFVAAKEECPSIQNMKAKIWEPDNMGKEMYYAFNQFMNITKHYVPYIFRESLFRCAGASNITMEGALEIFRDHRCVRTARPFLRTLLEKDIKNHSFEIKKNVLLKNLLPITQAFLLDPIFKMRDIISRLKEGECETICQLMQHYFAPCFKNRILPLIMRLLNHSHCCEGFYQMFKNHWNRELSDGWFMEFMTYFLNFLCARSRGPDKNPEMGQRCIFPFIQTFMNIDFPFNLLSILQFPNKEQACKAFTGNDFKLTNGEICNLQYNYGSCSTTLDQLYRFFLNTSFAVNRYGSDVFDVDAPCIPAYNITEVQTIADKFHADRRILEQYCIHITFNFSQSCTFDDVLVEKFDFLDSSTTYISNKTLVFDNASIRIHNSWLIIVATLGFLFFHCYT